MNGGGERKRSHDILFYSALAAEMIFIGLEWIVKGGIFNLLPGAGALALILVMIFTGVPKSRKPESLQPPHMRFVHKHALLVFMVLALIILAAIIIALSASGRMDLSAWKICQMVLLYELITTPCIMAGVYLGKYFVNRQGNGIPDEQTPEP